MPREARALRLILVGRRRPGVPGPFEHSSHGPAALEKLHWSFSPSLARWRLQVRSGLSGPDPKNSGPPKSLAPRLRRPPPSRHSRAVVDSPVLHSPGGPPPPRTCSFATSVPLRGDGWFCHGVEIGGQVWLCAFVGLGLLLDLLGPRIKSAGEPVGRVVRLDVRRVSPGGLEAQQILPEPPRVPGLDPGTQRRHWAGGFAPALDDRSIDIRPQEHIENRSVRCEQLSICRPSATSRG